MDRVETMSQQLYVEKPGKVLAEQFTEGMVPEAVGVHRCSLGQPGVEVGPPHVHANGQIYYLHDTDWILSDRWTAAPTSVLTDEQFQDTYGPGGGGPVEGG
jgi:hypothetical protein